MKTKSTFILFGALLSIAPLAASAYSVYNYDPTYTPYNLAPAIDHGPCEGEVEGFDAEYMALLEQYRDVQSGSSPGMTIGMQSRMIDSLLSNFKTIDLAYEEEFRQCLAQVDKEKLEAEQRAREKAAQAAAEAEAAAKAAAEAEALKAQQEAEAAARAAAELTAAKEATAKAAAEAEALRKQLEEQAAAKARAEAAARAAEAEAAAKAAAEAETLRAQQEAAEVAKPTTTEEMVEQPPQNEQSAEVIKEEPPERPNVLVRIWRFFTSWF